MVISVLLYGLASLLDSLISIYMVCYLGFVEVNPYMAPVLGTPQHFAREVLALLTLVSLVYTARRTLLFIAEKSGQKAIKGVAEKAWMVILLPVALRWSAVVHNTILLLTGWESPLSLIYRLTFSA